MTKEQRIYEQQKRNAARRGIKFLLTFEEWWNIWLTSGHWNDRGRKKGQYVMSRYGDLGNYEIGNVFIQTSSLNNSHSGNANPSKKRIGKTTSLKGMTSWLKGRIQPTVTCPHCGTVGGYVIKGRWHFDQCKMKP